MATLILPGLHGSGVGHWQRVWLDALDDAVLVAQDDWSRPDRDAWVARAAAAVRRHPGSLLVGHSLGAVLVAQLAAAHPDLPIAGALLVAPADVETAAAAALGLGGFAPLPADPLPFASILVGSRDDPWMTWARARDLAALWRSSLVDAGRAGHINADSGLGGWAEGRALLRRLAQAARPAAWPRQRHGAEPWSVRTREARALRG